MKLSIFLSKCERSRVKSSKYLLIFYSSTIDEQEVSSHAFDLIFAFDEIVALGYRESVNLAQIRTFTEMDSHEEKVWIAMRETQMKEAKLQMKEKAKELAKAKAASGKGTNGIKYFSYHSIYRFYKFCEWDY